jgi:two-component SAPR family response regulator
MKVLIVEDEALVAIDLAMVLEDMGEEVVGPASNLEAGLEFATNALVDFALLDVNLRGKQSTPIARLLNSRGIPFVFLTGYDSPKIEDDFPGIPIIPKPISSKDLMRVIESRKVCSS